MYQLLHFRSRSLRTLILGLICLTFYAYYRTTYYDVPQYNVPRNVSRSTSQEIYKQRSNVTIELRMSSLPKNDSPELSIVDTYNVQNVSNLSNSLITTQSTSSSQTTNVSIPVSKQSNEKSQTRVEKIINETKDVSVPLNECSARAIYEAGHMVPIPEKCPNFGKEMDLVIIIMSAPTHLEARMAIRQTWGHFGQRSDISILFMLGATMDSKVETILRKEQKTYNDVIRGKFLDSYSNLTLKTISTLEWVDNYCSKVKFLLKTDDDMFINVPRLQAFTIKHARDKNVIFGRLAKKWKPIRNKKSKYFVSQAQFKHAVFPDFTTGPAYLLSSDIVRKLYDAALDQTYLKLEDVFVTGIVADKLGIKRTHANEFLNKKISYSACNVQRGISIHMVKYSEQFDLWKKLFDGKSKCK
ncbi:beta-1,3-galactosyltransferase [Apis mellifera caucasica]|uniref:Hexosyltransferase n=1 Tax=Apis mellifera TaxID=7460 RepID=A0A7M6UWC1_APIME|nr:beta-1,3-galactosyltransferase [Apis mellifera]KAG6803564.1 beta-1,3-galactosyltransferase [Apis mellifera caucasica]BAR92726.1 beta-1,3-galactosyltransferase 1 [Apis mellifera]|eukprot:NP_001306198.1 beta-1,3-galactosyltransferase [Apis mellifera]